jgi:sigma-B regulation protein RsbU (phosphoserine phosphatase)
MDRDGFFRSQYRNYLILIPIFLVAFGYQIGYSSFALAREANRAEALMQPFLFDPGLVIGSPTPSATVAGIRHGDSLISVNGLVMTSLADFLKIVRAKQPGDRLAVVFQPAHTAERRSVVLTLQSVGASRPNTGDWALVTLIVFMSMFSVAVGIYVSALRPSDIRAFALFGILVGLTQFARAGYPFTWPDWMLEIHTLYTSFLQDTWPAWMMLFGIYFPERSAWDVRWPWSKWIFAGPILGVSVLSATASGIGFYNVSAAKPFLHPLSRLHTPVQILSFLATAVFFIALGLKMGSASNTDSKRRLRILVAGSAISLTPLLLILLWGTFVFRGDFGRFPQFLIIAVVVLLYIFPLTLAYIVIVQRAMDVRVAIRHGVRYTFAKGGLRIVLGCVTGLVMWGLAVAVFSSRANRSVQIAFFAVCAVTASFLIRHVRKRLGVALDRRFFREAYDAEQILNELSDTVRTMIDEQALLSTVTRRISESLHISCVAIFLNQNGTLRPVHSLGCGDLGGLELSETGLVLQRLQGSRESPRVYFDDPSNCVHTAPNEEIEVLKRLNTQLLLPVEVRGKLLGAISLGPKRSEEPYSKADTQLLKSVVFQSGLALENSRLASAVALEIAEREKMNREIEIAREVQQRLFPQNLPPMPGLDYWGACRPAQGVGGDYYDFVPLAGGSIGIAVGDVSGKGIAAALLMASLQASLRGQALQHGGDLTRVMANVNRLVYDATPPNRYATFFYAQYEPDAHRLIYVNAGHNPPVILRRLDGEIHVIRLETGGPVIGLFREAPYQQGSLKLEPGDILVGFTDGISEAMNSQDEEWGEERLLPALQLYADQSAAEIIPSVMAAADIFVDGAPQHDDMTLVVMKLAVA